MTATTAEDLGEFEGRIVTKTTIKIRKAGDGLSTALKTEPKLLHQGDTVHVVLECVVGPITMDPYDDGVCARVQDLLTNVATLIDTDVVRDAIEQQREKNTVAVELEKGVHRLPTPEALHGEHIMGDHNLTIIPGCPDCDEEIAAVQAETEADESEKAKRKAAVLDGAPKLTKPQLTVLAVLAAGPANVATRTDATGAEREVSRTVLTKVVEADYAVLAEDGNLAYITDAGRERHEVETA